MLVVVVVITCNHYFYFNYWHIAFFHPAKSLLGVYLTSKIKLWQSFSENLYRDSYFLQGSNSAQFQPDSLTAFLKISTTCSLQINALLSVGDPGYELLLFPDFVYMISSFWKASLFCKNVKCHLSFNSNLKCHFL